MSSNRMISPDFSYDRIIAEKIYHESIVPGSANVFRYDNVIELRGKQPQEVSDHWPVHVRLLAKHFLPKQWHDDENSRNISIGIKDRSSRPTQSQRNGRNQKSGDKIQRNRKRTKPINQVISSPIHKSKASRRSSSRMRNSALRISVLEDCDEDEWTSDMD
jgi:hypothetical protein